MSGPERTGGKGGRAFYALLALCSVLLLCDAFFDRHVSHPWEGAFGFYAVAGFVALVGIVLLARLLRRCVGRDEDYYDAG